MKSKHVMVVAPHPDDETLGCAGTMLKLIQEGVRVTWVIVTQMSKQIGYNQAQISKRRLEIEKVARAYGITKPRQMEYAAGQMDRVGTTVLVNDFRKLIEELKPDTIFIPNRSDAHSDHRIIADAVLGAAKTFRCPWVKNMLMYETISETETAMALPQAAFVPQVFVDITPFIDRKIAIMKYFTTEMGKPPFPRSEENIRALACWRGATAGFHYAESFMLLCSVIE